MLDIKNISVVAGEKEIIDKLSLEVKQGEVVALMGPNGSGKSTLAKTLMGLSSYQITEGEISLDEKNILGQTVDKRAQAGLFMAFQTPLSIEGVSVRQLLLMAVRKKDKGIKVSELRKEIEKVSQEMKINKELLGRGLNEDFSGGERKKMEVLQMKILKPKYIILDEIDSGLDLDALKLVAQGIKSLIKEVDCGVLVITHYQRILEYLKPDRVVILKEGRITNEGGLELVKKLDKVGYEKI